MHVQHPILMDEVYYVTDMLLHMYNTDSAREVKEVVWEQLKVFQLNMQSAHVGAEQC